MSDKLLQAPDAAKIDEIGLLQVIASHNEKRDHRLMGETVRDSLASHLRSMSIDNFSISGNTVRIGRTHWAASVCRCGDPACDGWALEPVVIAASSAVWNAAGEQAL